jgi:pyruvate dehydrogenase E2 component (dihydrolipoamide acetyltransferase)
VEAGEGAAAAPAAPAAPTAVPAATRAGEPTATRGEPAPKAVTDAVTPPVERQATTPSPAEARPRPERTLASPAARKRAAELGIDLAVVAPARASAITLQDVERAAARSAVATDADMRSILGRAMSRSKREIPHYYLATTIDMTRALKFVETWNAAKSVTDRLLYGALLLKAVARALEKVPELNGFWRDGRFEPSKAINVGTATRLRRGGLVAPALEDANRQPLPELMRRFQDVVQRARAGRLRRTELTSATITVSSIGEGGVDVLYPIIHPPQVAIVGFGSVASRPWCVDAAIVSARVITATLAADHRVSDGHRGSVFLSAVERLLQRPEEL